MHGHETEDGLIASVDQGLKRVEDQVGQAVPQRPLWKRIVLPLLGLVLVLVGLFFLVTPIPLSILIFVGFPLLFCFHPRIEAWARNWMAGRLDRLRIWVRGLRRLRDRKGLKAK